MGKHTIWFHSRPSIVSTYSVAGKKEGDGPIGSVFDRILSDDYFGEKTFEKAECKMLSTAIENVIKKSGYDKSDIDALISGDLLNQIVSASFAARDFNIPYIGIYNACSTVTEGLALGATIVDGGYMSDVVVATGSHFSTLLSRSNSFARNAPVPAAPAGACYRYFIKQRKRMQEKASESLTGMESVFLIIKIEFV